MRAVVKADERVGCTFVTDRPEPTLGPGQVRIGVGATSVCGTDAEIYHSTTAALELGLTYPVTMGHEVAGTIVEVGPDTHGLREGMRVAVETHLGCGECFYCRTAAGHNCQAMRLLGIDVDGAFAERVVVPARSCFVLPDEIGLEAAALLEPAGSAMHAVLRCGVPLAGASVLISGAGPVGLVLAQIASAHNARQVVVIEPNGVRRARAEQLGRGVVGLDVQVDPLEWGDLVTANRHGFDVAFECSGALPALTTLVRCVRNEGTVMAVGLVNGEFPLAVTRTLITRGLTLRGSFGRSLWATWDRLSGLVLSGTVDLQQLITHRLPLHELPAALDLMQGDAGKVVLLPSLDTTVTRRHSALAI
ncbi:zinc-dependent alcohol dehydrogenase [Nocardioides acrostichi]|uniref:Alcohol dehydrogenase catalytic domain-containing protein n=1 Tax=Nocardioides acrostichi TaxID=2784339 RepID=A0A930V025_9ACTN|nr:alcohol dehydrogenase catalytic domain-containing protein [Nocardioides acrostichi]MBF4160744.1 alcohol dehydrogenase catalytic domain-containing protein [Nocardioides acrostichi]